MSGLDALRDRVREKLHEQRVVTLALLRLREQVGGSLFARYGVCGKEACVCRQGQPHGPYWVLSTRSAGKGGFTYLDAETAADARALVDRHRNFKAGLSRLRKLNGEIVSLLRRYQTAASRRSGKRLGVSLGSGT